MSRGSIVCNTYSATYPSLVHVQRCSKCLFAYIHISLSSLSSRIYVSLLVSFFKHIRLVSQCLSSSLYVSFLSVFPHTFVFHFFPYLSLIEVHRSNRCLAQVSTSCLITYRSSKHIVTHTMSQVSRIHHTYSEAHLSLVDVQRFNGRLAHVGNSSLIHTSLVSII